MNSEDHYGAESPSGASSAGVPALYCPIPSEIHPMAAMFDTNSLEFMKRFDIGGDEQQIVRLSVGMEKVAGRIAPRGDPAIVQLYSDYAIWLIALDDLLDEGPLATRPVEPATLLAKLQRSIEDPEFQADSHPICVALRNIRLRLEKLVSASAMQRWTRGICSQFLAEHWKNLARATGYSPVLNDYTYYRVHGGAITEFSWIACFSYRSDAPIQVWRDRRIAALAEMASCVTTFATDIYSYAKEEHRAKDKYNLIDAIRTTYGYSAQQATIAATAMHDRIMCRLLKLSEQVAEDADPGVAVYLQSLRNYARGIIDWTMATPRYRYLNGRDGDTVVQSAGLRDAPSDDSPEPLPIDSIAWWWEID